MLSVQPINVKPAFKGNYVTDIPYEEVGRDFSVDSAKEQWQGFNDEFATLSVDSNLPKPVRKFANFMKVISGGVVTALGVVWASKKAGNLSRNAFNSKVVQESIDKGRELYSKVKTPAKNLGAKLAEKIGDAFAKFKETGFGKKVAEKFTALKNSKFGKAIKYIVEKLKAGWNYIKKTISGAKNDITFDKVNDTTANVMGTGAGVAAAYDLAKGRKSDDVEIIG